jgi:hypothetical protein
MQASGDRGRRVRGNLIYITLHDGNVVVEYDGIEHGITDDLSTSGWRKKTSCLRFGRAGTGSRSLMKKI